MTKAELLLDQCWILTDDLDEVCEGLPALEVGAEVLHRGEAGPLPQLRVNPGDVGLGI